MKRSGFARKEPMARGAAPVRKQSTKRAPKMPAPKATLKSRQLAVTTAEKVYWSRLACEVGCIACMRDGNFNPHVSIHHIDGRTKPGCHMNVLPLCAGHHQEGTGEGKSMLSVHPWKTRFEARYGDQASLKARCDAILGVAA